jgi:hypothetical protein
MKRCAVPGLKSATCRYTDNQNALNFIGTRLAAAGRL